MQLPEAQMAVALAALHWLPHTPQCRGSVEVSKSSSVPPSQSSSTPLHASAAGTVPPSQTRVPERQASIPAVQAPVVLPQAAPPPGLPSSTEPSQSSSKPLHSSALPSMRPSQMIAPATQFWVPRRQTPMSLPQAAPPPGLFSSVMPSQSSSTPLQVSVVAVTPPVQVRPPATQVSAPWLQAPVESPHAAPPPGLPSSTDPSQSSSAVLHSSGLPAKAPWQTSPPSTQASRPWVQAPTELPQSRPASGLPWSMEPSQSSSTPLQSSVLGSIAPTHSTLPPMHWVVPGVQAPTSLPQAAPPPGSPSSNCMSQSSSRALQISTGGSARSQRYSQPLSSLPSMSKKPASHMSRVQAPAVHAPLPRAKRHTRPQRPQFIGSVSKATSSSVRPSQSLSRRSQRVSSSAVLVHRYSQPLAGSPSMSMKPTSQDSKPHSPAVQMGKACGGVQTTPQPPQLRGSRSVSMPSSMRSSQSSSRLLQSSSRRQPASSKARSMPPMSVGGVSASTAPSPTEVASGGSPASASSSQVRQ